MSRLLKNYIKLLIESAVDNEAKYADIIDSKNQELQQTRFYGDELNQVISQLNNVQGFLDIKYTLKKRGYSIIGSGGFRNVWSRDDVDFVIKVNNYDDDQSNQFEYNTYFNNPIQSSADTINTNEKYYDASIFPKLYGYDKKYGEWIIFEKVNTFNHGKLPITKFFPLFTQQIFNVFESIRDLLQWPDLNTFFTRNSRSIDEELFFFFTDLLKYFLYQVNFNNTVLVKQKFKKEIINYLMLMCPSPLLLRHSEEEVRSMIDQELIKKGININLTPDISYVIKRLENVSIWDSHEGNFGYRDIKDPSKPWKSFVVIDYSI
jgi:hypothetical protein